MRIFYVLFALTLIVSCQCKDTPTPTTTEVDADGVTTKMPFIWQNTLYHDLQYVKIGMIRPAPYYKGNILVPSAEGGEAYWQLMRASDGKFLDKRWKVDFSATPYIKIGLQSDNNFVVVENYVLNIDLETATPLWKNDPNEAIDEAITGNGKHFFVCGTSAHPENLENGIGYYGDMADGTLHEFIYPKFQTTYLNPFKAYGAAHWLLNTVATNGDTLVVVYFADALPNWTARGYCGLYNFNKRTWVYEKQPLYKDTLRGGGNDGITWAKQVGNYIYAAAGNGIACNDLMTGKQIWEHGPFASDFLSSGFIVEDNKLVANCEDGNLYCYDALTGQLRWQVKNTGTCSPMFTLNGVIYYRGGGDGLLHAVELDSGKHLWKLNCPDSPDSWFYGSPYVIPGENGAKGKIICATANANIYCYEAAR